MHAIIHIKLLSKISVYKLKSSRPHVAHVFESISSKLWRMLLLHFAINRAEFLTLFTITQRDVHVYSTLRLLKSTLRLTSELWFTQIYVFRLIFRKWTWTHTSAYNLELFSNNGCWSFSWQLTYPGTYCRSRSSLNRTKIFTFVHVSNVTSQIFGQCQ